MKRVVVGSGNTAKLTAVREAFELIWPEEQWEVVAVPVDSGVRNQPLSDDEAIEGACNRAREALAAQDADFGVGLEGGIQQHGNRWFACGWMAVCDRAGKEGIGSSVRMELPESIVQAIVGGKELRTAADEYFGELLLKDSSFFGRMTKNHITRVRGYRDGVVSALATFHV